VIDRRRRSPRRNFNLPNGAGEKTEIEWLSADAPDGDDGGDAAQIHRLRAFVASL
jgi:hypothetical protein